MQSIFCDKKGMKIEINRRKVRKSPNMWKLQDTLKPSVGQR